MRPRSSHSKAKSVDCERHDYCPHLHFQNCQTERESNIACSGRPSRQIDVPTNMHPKILTHRRVANTPTLAYERYSQHPILPQQEETNFTRNYYLENVPDKFRLDNEIVRELVQEQSEGNAYVLAAGATKDYNAFAAQRRQHLKNAQRRAAANHLHFFQEKKEQQEKVREEQTRWITEYCRKVEQLIENILGKGGENEDPNLQDKLFIKEQEGKDTKYLAKVKVREPNDVLNVLQALRANLLKKKLALEQDRMDQEHKDKDKSVSASCLDASNTSQSQNNLSSASFVSAATNETTGRVGQSQLAEKYCDFESLSKKWGATTVEQVRDILRRMFARDMVNRAEGSHMREKKKAAEKDEYLKKQMENLGGLKRAAKGKTAVKKEEKKEEKKSRLMAKVEDIEIVPAYKEPLNKEEQAVKNTLLKGGIFDSLGDSYQRNRNYSLLFRTRANSSLLFSEEKEQLSTRHPR